MASKSFKIVTCDPMDDVVDNFSVLSTGVARHTASKVYEGNLTRWSKLYEALCLVYKLEERFYDHLKEDNIEESFRLVKINTIGSAERESIMVQR
jgi:hypothetical protein